MAIDPSRLPPTGGDLAALAASPTMAVAEGGPTLLALYNPANMDEVVIFPVTPVFKDDDAALKMSWSVARRGGISRPLGRQERVYTFSVLLPGATYKDQAWVHDWRPPSEINDQLKAWHAPVAKEGVPLRLVWTGPNAGSDPVYISKRTGNHNDGFGSLTLDMELIEIRNLTVRYDGEGVDPTQPTPTQVTGDSPGGDPPTPPDTPDSYTTQDGDSLYSIAAAQLGDGGRWQEIYDLNADAIGDDPDSIPTGLTLQLPGDGSGQAASDDTTDDSGG